MLKCKQIHLLSAIVLMVAIYSLTACGDDVSNEYNSHIVQEEILVVADVSELPECSSENEGEQTFVKGEPSSRICVDSKWFATFSDYSDKLKDFKCEAEKLKDDSGLKILCNGDSIGVVLNGQNGSDGAQGVQGEKGDKGDAGAQGVQGEKGDKGDTGAQGVQGEKGDKGDTGAQGIQGEKGETGAAGVDGESCSINRNENVITIICGNKIATINVGEVVGDDTSLVHFEEVVLDSQKIAVKMDSLSGFVQKGPFLKGSLLSLYELEDGRTLKQGEGAFTTYATNDSGYYKFMTVDLSSQYALLQVKGTYKNEVTGNSSDDEITLNALLNVLERKTANVNLLTHLEYGRANYLVTRAGKKPNYAKKLAWSEILAMFYIDSEGKKYFEDMNLFDADESSSVLLAISVILQGNNSSSELAALLTKISNDIETDGTWDDEETKASIADWAESFNGSTAIRTNLENFGVSAVLGFEKYLTNFWTHEYGLGPCEALRYKEVARDTSPSSQNYGIHYYCDINGWRKASDLEKDIYGWNEGAEGEVRQGQVNTDKFYIYGNGAWQVYSSEVETNIGVCTIAREGEVRKSGDTYYICRSKIWNVATPYEYNTYGWQAGSEGDVRKGAGSVNEYYIFTGGVWTEYPVGNDLGVCIPSRENEVGLSGGVYYICSSSSWVEATVLEYDTYGITCEDNGSVIDGKVIPTNKYVCDNGIFRMAKEREILLGESCAGFTMWKTIRKAYTSSQDSLYYCSGTEWEGSEDVHYDVMTDLRDYKTYKIVTIGRGDSAQTWMAENLNYEIEDYYSSKSYCYNDSAAYCNKYGRLYSWPAAIARGGDCGSGHKCSLSYPLRGICPEGWHLPESSEWVQLWRAVEYDDDDLKALNVSSWPNTTNSSGFSALPAGFYHVTTSSTYFGGLGEYAVFWTATMLEKSNYYSEWRYFYPGSQTSIEANRNRADGYSVRCVKD